MPDFSKRSDAIEIMDDLQCSGEVVCQTLRELENINAMLGGNYVTINGIHRLLKTESKECISIADVGCGSGDILRLLRKWSVKKSRDLRLTGMDANPFIVSYARAHTQEADNIRFEVMNIFADDFKSKEFDIITGTLFFHHFTRDELILFFDQLKSQVRIGFVINDIHRHWFAYYAIKFLTRWFSRSGMVKFDAPLSVLRAFRKNELKEILEKAGLVHYSIRWMWAFRWQVIARAAK